MSVKDDLRIYPIDSSVAKDLVVEYHYSGKPYAKSQLHLGVYWKGDLEGVLSFGPPIDRRQVLGLVEGTEWHEMCELNRMAFSEQLPKNSESRSLAVCARLFKKYAPWIDWILSYADGTQCGDGTIYRAAGWELTGWKENTSLWRAPDGRILSDIGLRTSSSLCKKYGVPADNPSAKDFEASGMERLEGYQYRYIKPLKYGLSFACETYDYDEMPAASSGAA